MNNYVVQIKVEGTFEVFGLQCSSEEEALEEAKNQFCNADFEDLSSCEYDDPEVEEYDNGTYSVSMHAFGFIEPDVEAQNRDEAEVMAMEQAINGDYGPLTDLDFELQDYYGNEPEDLFDGDNPYDEERD